MLEKVLSVDELRAKLLSFLLAFPLTALAGSLLTNGILPEVAYFDADAGSYDTSGYLFVWKAVTLPAGPSAAADLNGKTCYYNQNDPSTGMVTFDGYTCRGMWAGDLPVSWNNGPTSAFTAVWIGRFSGSPADQTFLSLSRNINDYDRQLYWGTSRTFIYSDQTGYALNFNSTTVPQPPSNRWTMEVLVRHEGATQVSYHRYGESYQLSTWNLPSTPCSIGGDSFSIGGDVRDGAHYFHGDLSVLLLYNRVLAAPDILSLAAFYSPRFGWNIPQPLPPSSPAAPPSPRLPPASPSPPPSPSPSSPPSPYQPDRNGYLGCYGDANNPNSFLMPDQLEVSREVTTGRCRGLAQMRGYRYFGLQGGDTCYGSFELRGPEFLAPSDNCWYPCAGDSRESCGGVWAMSVFRTDPLQPLLWPLPPSSPSPPPSPQPSDADTAVYLGCYQNREQNLLPDLLEVSVQQTPDRCRGLAFQRGYHYFGLMGGMKCYGSNDLHGTQDLDFDCNLACPGNIAHTCGGYFSISVFSAGSKSRSSAPRPPLPSPSYKNDVHGGGDGVQLGVGKGFGYVGLVAGVGAGIMALAVIVVCIHRYRTAAKRAHMDAVVVTPFSPPPTAGTATGTPYIAIGTPVLYVAPGQPNVQPEVLRRDLEPQQHQQQMQQHPEPQQQQAAVVAEQAYGTSRCSSWSSCSWSSGQIAEKSSQRSADGGAAAPQPVLSLPPPHMSESRFASWQRSGGIEGGLDDGMEEEEDAAGGCSSVVDRRDPQPSPLYQPQQKQGQGQGQGQGQVQQHRGQALVVGAAAPTNPALAPSFQDGTKVHSAACVAASAPAPASSVAAEPGSTRQWDPRLPEGNEPLRESYETTSH